MSKKKEEWQTFAANIDRYPGRFHGRGIIICAGGLSYFTYAWISIKILRDNGCPLPIEFWYQEGDLNRALIGELQNLGVQCRRFEDYISTEIRGYQLKCLAILLSNFKEVLYIDSDNVCLSDPEYLFQEPVYRKSGAVFWPDFWHTSLQNPIWRILDIEAGQIHEQESGQLLIDKEKCWHQLNLCTYFNLDPFYYKILWGDKDTFRFAWMALNKSFHMIAENVASLGYSNDCDGYCGIAMQQHDIERKPLFIHSNLLKWDTRQNNRLLWQEMRCCSEENGNCRYLLKNRAETGATFLQIGGKFNHCPTDKTVKTIEAKALEALSELRKSAWYKDFYHL